MTDPTQQRFISPDVLLTAIQLGTQRAAEAKVHRSYLGTLLALAAEGKVEILREEPPSHTIVRSL